MRILYGVQGTGNGHLARARRFAEAFDRTELRVDWLFSGRDRARYFDMGAFGEARYFCGLGLAATGGRIDRWATARRIAPFRVLTELGDVRPERYDLVISDYEPLVAWSAKYRGIPSLGIGHQYALVDSAAPLPRGDLAGRAVLRHFAPVRRRLGLHWQRYAPGTLPPVIDPTLEREEDEGFTMVYRPFDATADLVRTLRRLPDHRFELFAPDVRNETDVGHVRVRPCSHARFRERLVRCSRVVCSTGFELVSEALHLGLPVLTRPIPGQLEQAANALSLEALGWARVQRDELDAATLHDFCTSVGLAPRVPWPDVARAVVDELAAGREPDPEALAERLWRQARRPVTEASPAGPEDLGPGLELSARPRAA